MVTSVLAYAGKALVMAAGAALICVPAAGAEPGSGEACPQEQTTTDDQQQQCGDSSGPATPDIPDLSNENNNDTSQPSEQERGNCWLVNGVPRWSAPGVAPAPAGPFDVVTVCPEGM